MVERYVERIHTEYAVLDIGQDIGALVIYTREELRGKQIDVSPKGNNWHKVHTDVLERRVNGHPVFAALFLELPAGDYTILSTPTSEVTIFRGQVTEVDWRDQHVTPDAHRRNHSISQGTPSSSPSFTANSPMATCQLPPPVPQRPATRASVLLPRCQWDGFSCGHSARSEAIGPLIRLEGSPQMRLLCDHS